MAFGREVRKGFEVLGESHDEHLVHDGAQELIVNVGARRRLADHVTLLASLGRDPHNGIDGHNGQVGYLARS